MIDNIGTTASLPQEAAIVFGEYEHLVGIVSPADAYSAVEDFAVILVTAGMLPSAGPFRLHVDLAKSLKRMGITSLRFDLSGIGESLAVGGGGSSLERAASEISSAIDWLEQNQGITRVALLGLCSGADDGLFAAQRDTRIVGLFCIDGCGYRTTKFYVYRWLRNYWPKLRSVRAWMRFLGWASSEVAMPESLRLGTDLREFPDRETAAGVIASLVKRGVDLHFHYTGGVGEYYNYAHQFHEMFYGADRATSELLEQVTTSFAPESDHVAMLLEHREALVELATRRLREMR